MVAHPNFIRTGKDFHPYIVVAAFQKLRALREVLMGLEVVENVLPLMLPPTIIQQNCFDEVGIQKRRKCITPGVSVIVIQL